MFSSWLWDTKHVVDAEDAFMKLELGKHHNSANVLRNISFFCTINASQIEEAPKSLARWPKDKRWSSIF